MKTLKHARKDYIDLPFLRLIYGENHHLHYFTQEIFNNCVVCGAAAGIFLNRWLKHP
jgi:hypothetical protein